MINLTPNNDRESRNGYTNKIRLYSIESGNTSHEMERLERIKRMKCFVSMLGLVTQLAVGLRVPFWESDWLSRGESSWKFRSEVQRKKMVQCSCIQKKRVVDGKARGLNLAVSRH